jgi:hypothetical protein
LSRRKRKGSGRNQEDREKLRNRPEGNKKPKISGSNWKRMKREELKKW